MSAALAKERHWIDGKQFELTFTILLLVCAAGLIAYYSTENLTEAVAYSGFLPPALVDPVWHLPAFAQDFPNGMSVLTNSLPLSVYPILGRLGLSGEQIFYFMMPLEILSLAAGGYFATRLLNAQASKVAACLVALYLFGSSLANSDLARWTFPFYGSSYNYAYGLGLIGAALAITGRLRVGALLLALAVAAHPIIGLLFSFFTGTAVLSAISRYRIVDLATASAIGLVITGAWWALRLQDAAISGPEIPAETFDSLVRMMSFHLYPISLGVFSGRHFDKFFPFLSYLVLVSLYLSDRRWQQNRLQLQVAAGLAGLLFLGTVGLFVSEYAGSPFLTKLALHRATAEFLVLGTIIVVPGLWQDVRDGPAWRSGLALIVLLFPFLTSSGVPLLPALMLGLGTLVRDWRQTGSLTRQRMIVISTVLAGVTVAVLWVFLTARFRNLSHDAYTGISQFSGALGLVLLLIVAVWFLARRPAQLALVAVAVAAISWTPTAARFSSESELTKARAYLEVEKWAQENTPSDALFMLDPVHAYGWRAYSRRPSFGSVREWLYAGWLYDTKADVLNEGISRVESFGLTLDDYLKSDEKKRGSGRRLVAKDLRMKYYRAGSDWYARMAREYGIDYFVFDMSFVESRPPLDIVFSNEAYLVGRISNGQINGAAKATQ